MTNWDLMRFVVEHDDLTTLERMVMVCLVWHRNNTTGDCWPSHGLISKESGASRNSVIRAIRSLKDKGIVSTKRTGKSNRYEFEMYHRATSRCITMIHKPLIEPASKTKTKRKKRTDYRQPKQGPSGERLIPAWEALKRENDRESSDTYSPMKQIK